MNKTIVTILAAITVCNMAFARNDLSMNKFIDILFSIAFGLIVKVTFIFY